MNAYIKNLLTVLTMNAYIKNLLTVLTPLILLFTFASSAQAVCDRDRLHVVRSEGAPGGVQIYDLAPAAVLPTFYYRYTTNNLQAINDLNAAWVGNFTVRVIGNAGACGAAGVVRNGGAITFLFRDSFF
jgi:hypothetical protein